MTTDKEFSDTANGRAIAALELLPRALEALKEARFDTSGKVAGLECRPSGRWSLIEARRRLAIVDAAIAEIDRVLKADAV